MTESRSIPLPPLQDGVIATYGDLIEDQVVALRGPLEINGLVEGTIVTRPGGSAPNSAIAATKAGSSARFIGHCGDDEISDRLSQNLADNGVDYRSIRKGRRCAVFAVQLASGEAALIHDPGGRWSVVPEDIKEDWFEGVAIVHLTGFNLFYPQIYPAFMEVVRIAKKVGAQISFDCAATNLMLDYGTNTLRDLLEQIQPAVVLCNEREGEVLGLPYSPLKSVPFIVQHRGAAATKIYAGGESFTVPVTPLDDVIDFVGAGDAFSGGFLAGWRQGLDVITAVELALVTASTVIREINVPSAAAPHGPGSVSS